MPTALLTDLPLRLLRRGYWAAVRTRVEERAPGRFRTLRAEIERSADAIAAGAHAPAGEASRTHLALASLILASYRALAVEVRDRGAAIETLKFALLSAYRRLLRLPFKLVLALSRDRFRTLAALAGSERLDGRLFGSGFRVERRAGDPVFELLVDRCFYHSFFVAHGAPELTQIICHSDHAWIDELDPARDGLRFERPSTLGWGGAQCVFRFQRRAAVAGVRLRHRGMEGRVCEPVERVPSALTPRTSGRRE